MAFYTPRERHIADLHEAFRTESIDRRTFFKVAGAAAVASGRATAHQPERPLHGADSVLNLKRTLSSTAARKDISNLDPHGHDYSIAWGQKAVYDATALRRKPR